MLPDESCLRNSVEFSSDILRVAAVLVRFSSFVPEAPDDDDDVDDDDDEDNAIPTPAQLKSF